MMALFEGGLRQELQYLMRYLFIELLTFYAILGFYTSICFIFSGIVSIMCRFSYTQSTLLINACVKLVIDYVKSMLVFLVQNYWAFCFINQICNGSSHNDHLVFKC